MKIKLIPVYYSCDGCFRTISVNCWYVGKYPLSYTVRECVEVYCELVGWKLLHLYKEDGDMETYSMRVEMPFGENASHTVYNNYYDSTVLKGIV